MTDPDSPVTHVIASLSARPVPVPVATAALPRGSGVYAWWAKPSVFPDLPGMPNPAEPADRLLYVGRATSLRGRITRNHLRRSGSSTLRRTLAGLLMPTTGYQTMWTDRVVLVPEDEVRLTRWMQSYLRLTWAEYAWPEEIEAEVIWRMVPPLNVSGMEPDDIQPSVIAAKAAFQAITPPPAE